MGKKRQKLDARDNKLILNMDDHSPAQRVVEACTFIASFLTYVAEKASLT